MVSLEGNVRGFMQRPKYNHILVVKGNYLMHAHCTRTPLPDFFQSQLETMLSGCKNLIKAFVDQCQQRMWVGPAMEVIRFNQLITQAMWLKGTNSQLLQLPNFTKVQIKDAAKAMSGSESIEKFLALDLDAKTAALSSLSPSQKADVILACDLIPRVSATVSTFVEDDEDQKIYANDLITVRVKVDRLNLAEGQVAGLVHAPRFPEPRKESWWVILSTKDGKIVSIENVAKKEKVFNHDIKFMAPPQGAYDMVIHVLSNDYVGLDKQLPLHFDVNDPSLLPKFVPHKDDMDLDEEPTMFEQMMAGNIEEDSEDEDSDSDVEDVTSKVKTVKKAKEEDSDSDSDDDDMPVLKKEGTAEGKKDQ
jgi:translocation protein SEC63